jgi:hypothetical protein
MNLKLNEIKVFDIKTINSPLIIDKNKQQIFIFWFILFKMLYFIYYVYI